MAKYHINDKGNPGLCSAKKNCPFGGDDKHYANKTDAHKAYELSMAGKNLAAKESEAELLNEIVRTIRVKRPGVPAYEVVTDLSGKSLGVINKKNNRFIAEVSKNGMATEIGEFKNRGAAIKALSDNKGKGQGFELVPPALDAKEQKAYDFLSDREKKIYVFRRNEFSSSHEDALADARYQALSDKQKDKLRSLDTIVRDEYWTLREGYGLTHSDAYNLAEKGDRILTSEAFWADAGPTIFAQRAKKIGLVEAYREVIANRGQY